MKKNYAVQPIVVWTGERNQAYVDGTGDAFKVVQQWFQDQAKRTFNLRTVTERYWPIYQSITHFGVAKSEPCDPYTIIYLLVAGTPYIGGGMYGGDKIGCDTKVPGRAVGSGGPVVVMAGLDPEQEGFPAQPWFHDELHEVHGGIAHEIGHCIGLPHPEDMATTIMGRNWHEFPAIGLSKQELAVIRKSPFFRGHIVRD